MSDIQKRVNDYYNTMYGYGELKPEGVVRQKLDEANERVAELEQQLAELLMALRTISTAPDDYGVCYCRQTAKNAIEEQNSPVVSTGGADQS